MSELQSSSYGDPVPYKHRDLPPISEDGYRRSGRGYDQGPDGYIAVERGPHSTYPSRGSSSNYGSTHIQNSIYPTSPPSETLYDSCGSSAADHHRYLEPVGDVSDQRNKRRKGNLPKQVTHILRNWFTEHVGHPYPTEEEKQMLMVQTGLTLNQVSGNCFFYLFYTFKEGSFDGEYQISNWFINARRRSLPQLAKQARAEADLRENQNGSYKSARDTGMRRSRG
ncbi:hypothetical protein MMC20_005409 [Loxospora ochrophaea]|nr:hypothetical protein [Loxospora ochrophaea]